MVDFKIYTCKCGKKFVPTPEWLYKIRKGKEKGYYCSYTCYRKAGGDGGTKR